MSVLWCIAWVLIIWGFVLLVRVLINLLDMLERRRHAKAIYKLWDKEAKESQLHPPNPEISRGETVVKYVLDQHYILNKKMEYGPFILKVGYGWEKRMHEKYFPPDDPHGRHENSMTLMERLLDIEQLTEVRVDLSLPTGKEIKSVPYRDARENDKGKD